MGIHIIEVHKQYEEKQEQNKNDIRILNCGTHDKNQLLRRSHTYKYPLIHTTSTIFFPKPKPTDQGQGCLVV